MVGELVEECLRIGAFRLDTVFVFQQPVFEMQLHGIVGELYDAFVVEIFGLVKYLFKDLDDFIVAEFKIRVSGTQVEELVEHSGAADPLVEFGCCLDVAERVVEPSAACGQCFALRIVDGSVEEYFHFDYVVVVVGGIVEDFDEVVLVEKGFGIAAFDYFRFKLFVEVPAVVGFVHSVRGEDERSVSKLWV